MLSRRRAVSPEQRAHAGSVITAQVLLELKRAGTVMLYASMPEEIDLFPLMEKLISAGKRIALPEITGRGTMEARELAAMDALIDGAFDIPTPDPARGAQIPPEEIDVVIVPGAAFDADGGDWAADIMTASCRVRCMQNVSFWHLIFRSFLPFPWRRGMHASIGF